MKRYVAPSSSTDGHTTRFGLAAPVAETLGHASASGGSDDHSYSQPSAGGGAGGSSGASAVAVVPSSRLTEISSDILRRASAAKVAKPSRRSFLLRFCFSSVAYPGRTLSTKLRKASIATEGTRFSTASTTTEALIASPVRTFETVTENTFDVSARSEPAPTV